MAVFSIGFGTSLYSFKKNGTEYRFSLVPLGGYVLPAIEDGDDFFRIPVYKRVLFSLGGPFANLLLAIILFAAMNSVSTGITFFTVLIQPVIQTFTILGGMISSLAGVLTNTENLSGVIGIVSIGSKLVENGILKALNFTVLLSINLALINLLPVPALDGGKVVLFLLEKIHPRLTRLHIPMAVAGWLIIISLMILSTYNDVVKII